MLQDYLPNSKRRTACSPRNPLQKKPCSSELVRACLAGREWSRKGVERLGAGLKLVRMIRNFGLGAGKAVEIADGFEYATVD